MNGALASAVIISCNKMIEMPAMYNLVSVCFFLRNYVYNATIKRCDSLKLVEINGMS